MRSECSLISPYTYYYIVFTYKFVDYIKSVMIYKVESYFIHIWFVDETLD